MPELNAPKLVPDNSVCLDAGTAAEFLQGLLLPVAAECVEQHIDACSLCRRHLSELVRTLGSQAPVCDKGPEITSPSDSKIEPVPNPIRGVVIGRFLVLHLIGAGAMGLVFAAYDPDLDRKVALKLLRRTEGRETDAALTQDRLRAEAKSMARLSHPNIVPLYEVGRYGDGLFMAMELIDGITLRRWLDSQSRPRGEILDVFVQAGRGLAGAHAAGIVHRDFKPENVLVGHDGRVRVTDFGLARSMQRDEAPWADEEIRSNSYSARSGVILGTPAYMAPEQHRGLPADARADQFSFAVALYQALYQQHPFGDPRSPQFAESVLNGRVAPPPSGSRIPEWLRRALLRALCADPGERYPTMGQLLMALTKDPAAVWKRTLGAVAAVGLACTAALGTGYAVHHSRQLCSGASGRLHGVWDSASRAELRGAFLATLRPDAERAWIGAELAIEKYAQSLVATHKEACEATQVRGEQSADLLDRRMRCLGLRWAELSSLLALFKHADAEIVQRAIQAVSELAPIEACSDLTLLSSSLPLPERAALREPVAVIRRRLAELRALELAGKYTEARTSAAAEVAAARKLEFPPLTAEALYQLGSLEQRLVEAAATATLYDALWAAEASGYDSLTAQIWLALVAVTTQKVEMAEAKALLPRASAAVERLHRPVHLYIELLSATGNLYAQEARYHEALATFTAASQLAEQTLGAGHPTLARLYGALGRQHENLGSFDQARPFFERAHDLQLRALGPHHPSVAETYRNLGIILGREGDQKTARRYLEQAIRILAESYGDEHFRVAAPLLAIGASFLEEERYAEAIEPLRRAVAIYERNDRGVRSVSTASALNNLAIAYEGIGRIDDALRLEERARSTLEAAFGPEHPEVLDAVDELGDLYLQRGNLGLALKNTSRALHSFEAALGPQHRRLIGPLSTLCQVLVERNELAGAIRHARRALLIGEAHLGKAPPDLTSPLVCLGEALLRSGQHREAISVAERTLALVSAQAHAGQETMADARFLLARALCNRTQETARALRLAQEARQLYSRTDGNKRRLVQVDALLASLRSTADKQSSRNK